MSAKAYTTIIKKPMTYNKSQQLTEKNTTIFLVYLTPCHPNQAEPQSPSRQDALQVRKHIPEKP